MAKRISIITLCFLVMCIVTYDYLKIEYVQPNIGENFLLNEAEWENVCFSSSYGNPDKAISGITKKQCWGVDEVQFGSVFVTYITKGGSCIKQSLRVELRKKGNSESMCFQRNEIKNALLSNSENLIKLELVGQSK